MATNIFCIGIIATFLIVGFVGIRVYAKLEDSDIARRDSSTNE